MLRSGYSLVYGITFQLSKDKHYPSLLLERFSLEGDKLLFYGFVLEVPLSILVMSWNLLNELAFPLGNIFPSGV